MSSAVTPAPSPFLHRVRFSDHDELSSLIREGQAEFLQNSAGAFRGTFTTVALDGGTVQFGRVELSYLCRGAVTGNRTVFLLHLNPEPDYVWKGRSLDPGAMVVLPPGSEHHDISPAGSYWALISFDRPALERVRSLLNGMDPILDSTGSQALLPLPGPMEALRRQLKAVHSVVQGDSQVLAVPEARRGLEESVLSALSCSLISASRLRPDGYGAAARTRAIRQVEAYLSANSGDTLYLADLCAVAGVGERTLRYIFQERYGMSPVQYLKLRRLHQVRKALRRADPDGNTVHNIANRCGIWHVGRFASQYRALFQEAPHETLRKACPIVGPGSPPPITPLPRRDSLRPPGLD